MLERALELLEEGLGIVRGAVFLFHEDSGFLSVAAALGISDEGLGARYRPGEGIIGRVLQSGRPVVVPASAREPLLLNRAFQRRRTGLPEVSVLCVPIAFDRQPAGVLVVDVPFQPGPRLPVRHAVPRGRRGDDGSGATRAAAPSRTSAAGSSTENKNLRHELEERYDLSNIVGTSGPMQQVYEQIAQVAHTNTTVLIRGESGTGKELIAHAIHYNSPRAEKPFVKVSCAALPGHAHRVRAVRLREGRVHRRAGAEARAASSWPTAARCSSTRSAS